MKFRNYFIFIFFFFLFGIFNFGSGINKSYADLFNGKRSSEKYRVTTELEIPSDFKYCLPQVYDNKGNPSKIKTIFSGSNVKKFTDYDVLPISIDMGSKAGNEFLENISYLIFGITEAVLIIYLGVAIGEAVGSLGATAWVVVCLVAVIVLYAIVFFRWLSIENYIVRLYLEFIDDLVDTVKTLFTNISQFGESLLNSIESFGRVFGMFNLGSSKSVYTSSDRFNAVRDASLRTNYYCYNVAGFAAKGTADDGLEDVLSPYLYKEMDIMNNKYLEYPIYPKKSIITKGQCDPSVYVNDYNVRGESGTDTALITVAPFYSKCSYAFTPNNRQCLLTNIGIVVAGIVVRLAVKIACDYASLNSVSAIISTILDTLMAIFGSPLGIDSRTVIDFYLITVVHSFYLSFAGIFGVHKMAFNGLICVGAAFAALALYEATTTGALEIVNRRRVNGDDKKKGSKGGLKYIKFCGDNYFSYNGITTRTDDMIDDVLEEYLNKNIVGLTYNNGDSKKVKKEKLRDFLLANSEITVGTETIINPLYEYFTKGVNEYSYAKCVDSCMNGTFTKSEVCKECFEKLRDSESIENGGQNYRKESIIDEISNDNEFNSANVSNRLYREWVYGGKEYKSPIKKIDDQEYEDQDLNYYIYDPRLPSVKGFDDLNQRYYMRGNEEGKFACERFKFYDGSGCILHEDRIADANCKNNDKNKVADGFYEISDAKLPDGCSKRQFRQECINAFGYAYSGCVARMYNYVCLEDTDGSVEDEDRKYTFCEPKEEGPNLAEEFNSAASTNVMTLIMNKTSGNEDEYSESFMTESNCSIGGIDFIVSKKAEEDPNDDSYACVFSENLCPYNFRLNGGLNYPTSYCDAGFAGDKMLIEIKNLEEDSKIKPEYAETESLCKTGIFNEKDMCLSQYNGKKVDNSTIIFDEKKLLDGDNNYENFKYNFSNINDGFALTKARADMKGYNDNDYALISPHECNTKAEGNDCKGNSLIQSAAVGQLKNYCQFRAHCVRMAKFTEDDTDLYASAFMDSSCNGRGGFSRMADYGVAKRLSSDVVQCVHETLQNMINGVSAISKCKSGTPNNEGYCGPDTAETIEEAIKDPDHLKQYYKDDGKENYVIKGKSLPLEANPVEKLRTNMMSIIRIALALAVVFWGFSTILYGKVNFREDRDAKKAQNLMLNAVKFSVVCAFTLSSGWQKGKANKYLVDFATSTFSFLTRIVNSSIDINSSHSVILNDTYRFGVVKDTKNYSRDAAVDFCYYAHGKTDDRNTLYEFSDLGESSCSNLFYKHTSKNADHTVTIKSSIGFNDFMYFIDKTNKANKKVKYYPFVCDKNSCTTNLANSGIWNTKYDGCFFSQNEYPEGKEYLMIFDTLDCKVLKYFGLEGTKKVPTLLIFGIIVAFLGVIGTFILGISIVLVMMIINLIIQAIFIFVNCFFTIGILVVVSPIIIPLVMFERTKNIFNKWLTKIISRVILAAFMTAAVVMYVQIMDIVALQGLRFKNYNNAGRMAVINVSKSSDLNYFNLINNPAKSIVIGVASAAKAVFSTIKALTTEDKDLSSVFRDNKLIAFFFQMLMIYMLFKLVNDILGNMESIVQKLLDTKEKVYGKGTKEGLGGGMANQSKIFGKAKGIASTATGITRGAAQKGFDSAERSLSKSALGKSEFGMKVKSGIHKIRRAKNKVKNTTMGFFRGIKGAANSFAAGNGISNSINKFKEEMDDATKTKGGK